ncbi:hypothetical protein AB9X29_003760 [Vibrio vulnificus]
MTYERSNDTRVNNVLAIQEGVNARVVGDRKVIVVSRIGNGGADIAMERAKKVAVLLQQKGETDPRMYVRQVRPDDKTQWENGAVELFVFPLERWNDAAFVQMMTTQSLQVSALGGVLRSDVARLSLSEVFMRSVKIGEGDVSEQFSGSLQQVGWRANFKNMPQVNGPAKEYVISLPESGLAEEKEVVTLVREIAKQAKLMNLQMLVNTREKSLTLGYQLVNDNKQKGRNIDE